MCNHSLLHLACLGGRAECLDFLLFPSCFEEEVFEWVDGKGRGIMHAYAERNPQEVSVSFFLLDFGKYNNVWIIIITSLQ